MKLHTIKGYIFGAVVGLALGTTFLVNAGAFTAFTGMTQAWFDVVKLKLDGAYTSGKMCTSDASGTIQCITDVPTGGSDCQGVAVGTACGGGIYAGGGIVAYTADEGAMAWSTALTTCLGKTYGGFKDWILPTNNELRILYTYRATIGGFSTAYYWSSTESSTSTAWSLYFWDGGISNVTKPTSSSIRCVRKF